jgi:hypothetical protein
VAGLRIVEAVGRPRGGDPQPKSRPTCGATPIAIEVFQDEASFPCLASLEQQRGALGEGMLQRDVANPGVPPTPRPREVRTLLISGEVFRAQVRSTARSARVRPSIGSASATRHSQWRAGTRPCGSHRRGAALVGKTGPRSAISSSTTLTPTWIKVRAPIQGNSAACCDGLSRNPKHVAKRTQLGEHFCRFLGFSPGQIRTRRSRNKNG